MDLCFVKHKNNAWHIGNSNVTYGFYELSHLLHSQSSLPPWIHTYLWSVIMCTWLCFQPADELAQEDHVIY